MGGALPAVSILVLVDVALEPVEGENRFCRVKGVSILVLVDVALELSEVSGQTHNHL